MTPAQELVAFLFATTILVSRCGADRRLPAPTDLTYKWIDLFSVNVSWLWRRPEDLPENCAVSYYIHDHDSLKVKTLLRSYSHFYLTETMPLNEWEVQVQTVSPTPCSGWNESKPANLIISRPKSYAKLVNDFKCYCMSKKFNCSWTPVKSSADVKVSYWYYNGSKEDMKCEVPYSGDGRKGCILEPPDQDLFVLAETKTEMSSFKAQRATPVPKLVIKENGDYLRLEWTSPDIGPMCTWKYCFWYKECNVDKNLQCVYNRTQDIPYNKCCEYNFQYNLSTTKYCLNVLSDNSGIVTYGTTKPCLKTASVFAIMIPLILCFCVILSFYCFSRHREMFCIKLPNHFEIKNMVNEILEKTITKDKVYTPQMEHTETLITFPPQNH